MTRFYEKIIGCRNEGIYRVVTLFGIKFKRKNARVQTLAEITKLSTQCADLTVAVKSLSEFSKQSHETINVLLSKGLAEISTRLESLNKISGEDQQETTRKLGDASSILKSLAAMLAEFRSMQTEVNQLQDQNHQASVQKLDEVHNLLQSHTEKLTEVHTMQGEVNKVQMQNHQVTTRKLDDAINLVRTNVGRTGSLLELEYDFARYYQYSFEKGFLFPMSEYMDRPDFEEKYLALIRGMAPPSVCEVNKILSRVRMVKAKPDQTRYNFYSISEQDEKTKLRTDFENRILRINDNLYAYDKYLLPIRHFEICVFLHKHGIEIVRDKGSVRKKDMIDAGGFIGDSALVLSDYTDGKIYSFEPNPKNFDLLKKTLEINHLSRVVPIQKALWSSETGLEMYANVGGSASASSLTKLVGIKYVEKAFNVQAITLDCFVRENKLDVGLIKVDLEGAELEFLKGAEHTIRTQKPVLLLSIYHKPSDFFELKPLLEQWVPEYEFSVFNPVDWSILFETMIVAQPRLPLSQTP